MRANDAFRRVTAAIREWTTNKLDGYIEKSQIDVANGVAGLDADGYVKKVRMATYTRHGIVLKTNLPTSNSDSTVPSSYAMSLVREEALQAAAKDWDQSDTTKPDYIKNRPFYREVVAMGAGEKIIEYVTVTPTGKEIYDPNIGRWGEWDSLPRLNKAQYTVDIQIDSNTTKRVICQLTTDYYYDDSYWDESGSSNESWYYYLNGDGVSIQLEYMDNYYDYEGNKSLYATITHNYAQVEKIVIYEHTDEADYRVVQLDEVYIPDTIARTEALDALEQRVAELEQALEGLMGI